jgi:hypothetical protein
MNGIAINAKNINKPRKKYKFIKLLIFWSFILRGLKPVNKKLQEDIFRLEDKNWIILSIFRFLN